MQAKYFYRIYLFRFLFVIGLSLLILSPTACHPSKKVSTIFTFHTEHAGGTPTICDSKKATSFNFIIKKIRSQFILFNSSFSLSSQVVQQLQKEKIKRQEFLFLNFKSSLLERVTFPSTRFSSEFDFSASPAFV